MTVNAPDADVTANVTALPASFLDATALLRERCAARRGGEAVGSFTVTGRDGIPASPDGYLPAALDAAGPQAEAAPGGRLALAVMPAPGRASDCGIRPTLATFAAPSARPPRPVRTPSGLEPTNRPERGAPGTTAAGPF